VGKKELGGDPNFLSVIVLFPLSDFLHEIRCVVALICDLTSNQPKPHSEPTMGEPERPSSTGQEVSLDEAHVFGQIEERDVHMLSGQVVQAGLFGQRHYGDQPAGLHQVRVVKISRESVANSHLERACPGQRTEP
jgi:hypothetical protein